MSSAGREKVRGKISNEKKNIESTYMGNVTGCMFYLVVGASYLISESLNRIVFVTTDTHNGKGA